MRVCSGEEGLAVCAVIGVYRRERNGVRKPGSMDGRRLND